MMLILNKDLNGDYITRDKLIFGGYDEAKYFGGLRSFRCCRDLMKTLIEENFASTREMQNCSPTIGEFMEITEDSDCDITFICYAISPERDDYRISIEGIDIVIPDSDFDSVSYFVESFHGADEFSFQHEESNYYLHAWWD